MIADHVDPRSALIDAETVLDDPDAARAVDYMSGFFCSYEQGDPLVAIRFDDGTYRSHAPTVSYWVFGHWTRFV